MSVRRRKGVERERAPTRPSQAPVRGPAGGQPAGKSGAEQRAQTPSRWPHRRATQLTLQQKRAPPSQAPGADGGRDEAVMGTGRETFLCPGHRHPCLWGTTGRTQPQEGEGQCSSLPAEGPERYQISRGRGPAGQSSKPTSALLREHSISSQ